MAAAFALLAAASWHQPARAEDLLAPAAILARIDGLIKRDAESWCRRQGMTYPPDAVVLRVFKKEAELELWAKNAGQKRMRLIRTLPICAMDFAPGTKLAEGDGKTPEGFYHPEFSYQSSNWWMWMDLAPDRVEEPGKVGKGSCFKMCIEYPNKLDRQRTRRAGFGAKTGGEICLHGNCVSVGCASFKNRDFLPVFAFSRHHDAKRFGKLQLHVFPFRFKAMSDESRAKAAREWTHAGAFGEAGLRDFWKNLERGYDAFDADPNPLRVRAGAAGYEFAGEPAAQEDQHMTKTADGPLLRLGKAADIGTDPAFKRLLTAQKKSPDHRAPARLRALLASFEILRMSMGEAYSHEDGAPSLVWWFGEIGVAGEASATAEKLRSGLSAAGFKPGPERDGKTAYARTSGGVTQEVVVDRPHRWVGGRRIACGFRLRWTVTDGRPAPAPPLAALLAALPVLRDARLEDQLYEALASTPTVSLAVGGTWTRYYDWDASFSAEGPEGAARLHGSLRALLAASGFEASGTGEDGAAAYERPKTGSFAWLSPPDAKGRVRLRIQPES